MKLSRPAGMFSVLACAVLAISFACGSAGGAQETSPEPSIGPEAPTTAVASTPKPSPSRTPHRMRPVILVRPTPWKYGIGQKASPKPKTSNTSRPATRPTATPAPSATPSPAPTPTPSPAAAPTQAPRGRARRGNVALPTLPPPAAQTLSPSESIEPQAASTAQAVLMQSRSSRNRATPSPTPTASPAMVPVNDGTLPYATPPPAENGAPTPIPTQPPTPRPLAPSQPSIPDSLADPNVRGIIARPIRQLSEIGWMQGTWHVTGVTNKEDGTTLPLDPTTYVFSPIMSNRWMFGADGKANDYIYLTFDPFARHWVALRFGSNPSYGMWTSEKGWVGNRIDFLTNFSYVNGRQYRRRLSIIHKDARTFGIYETEQTPDGSFIPDDAYEFKKL